MTLPAIPTTDLRTPAGQIPVPLIGFGAWLVDGEEGFRALRCAMDVGYRHVDTATGYGNEEQVGRAVGVSNYSPGGALGDGGAPGPAGAPGPEPMRKAIARLAEGTVGGTGVTHPLVRSALLC